MQPSKAETHKPVPKAAVKPMSVGRDLKSARLVLLPTHVASPKNLPNSWHCFIAGDPLMAPTCVL